MFQLFIIECAYRSVPFEHHPMMGQWQPSEYHTVDQLWYIQGHQSTSSRNVPSNAEG